MTARRAAATAVFALAGGWALLVVLLMLFPPLTNQGLKSSELLVPLGLSGLATASGAMILRGHWWVALALLVGPVLLWLVLVP